MKLFRFILLFSILLISIFTLSSVQGQTDFSNSLRLESGELVNGYVTESNGDNPQDKYHLQVSEGDIVEFKISSDELIDFCVYVGVNGTQELVCYYEMNGRDEISFLKGEDTGFYYVKISCESTSYECSSSASYSLLVTVYPDDAGENFADAVQIFPSDGISGTAFVDENGDTMEQDFYFMRVNPDDQILIIIASNDFGTSYRIYDENRTALISQFEDAPYDFQINVEDGTYLYLEVWCQQNNAQPCEYSIDMLGSTYVSNSESSDSGNSNDNTGFDYFGCFGLFLLLLAGVWVLGLIDPTYSLNKSPSTMVQARVLETNARQAIHQQTLARYEQQRIMRTQISNMDTERNKILADAEKMKQEIALLEKQKQDAMKEVELEKMKAAFAKMQRLAEESEKEKKDLQKQLENVKPSTIVHNVTYNIQDSAISGDINTGLQQDDDS